MIRDPEHPTASLCECAGCPVLVELEDDVALVNGDGYIIDANGYVVERYD